MDASKAKVKISISEGLIELEGTEEFVEKHLAEFKDKLSMGLKSPSEGNAVSGHSQLQKKQVSDKKQPIKASKTKGKNIEPEEFEIKNGEHSLQKFITEKNPGENAWIRIVVIGYYITHKLKKEYFTEGNVEFAYKALGLNKRPLHLRQAFIDVKNKRKWLEERHEGDGWRLSRLGEIYIEDQLPAKQ
jgi:hypothetical protein